RRPPCFAPRSCERQRYTARAPDRFGHAFVKHGAHGGLVTSEDRAEPLFVAPGDGLAFSHCLLDFWVLRRSGCCASDDNQRGIALAIRLADDIRSGNRKLSAACTGQQTFDPAI